MCTMCVYHICFWRLWLCHTHTNIQIKPMNGAHTTAMFRNLTYVLQYATRKLWILPLGRTKPTEQPQHQSSLFPKYSYWIFFAWSLFAWIVSIT